MYIYTHVQEYCVALRAICIYIHIDALYVHITYLILTKMHIDILYEQALAAREKQFAEDDERDKKVRQIIEAQNAGTSAGGTAENGGKKDAKKGKIQDKKPPRKQNSESESGDSDSESDDSDSESESDGSSSDWSKSGQNEEEDKDATERPNASGALPAPVSDMPGHTGVYLACVCMFM
jgi:hypothetical protein